MKPNFDIFLAAAGFYVLLLMQESLLNSFGMNGVSLAASAIVTGIFAWLALRWNFMATAYGLVGFAAVAFLLNFSGHPLPGLGGL